MKNNIIILMLLLSFISYAQKNKLKSGTITYETYLNTDVKKDLKNVSKEISTKIFKLLNKAEKVNCILKFKNNKTLFYLEDRMRNDAEKGLNIMKIGLQGIYYTNLLKNEITHQNESFGNLFLISKKPIKWKLTQEEKKIGAHLCYKATAEIKGENRNGVFTKKIIAWYAIGIPLSFGPKYYSGLPGLIIKLEEGKRTFILKKMKFNQTEHIIEKPTKGKRVSAEEYHEIVKKMVLNRDKLKY